MKPKEHPHRPGVLLHGQLVSNILEDLLGDLGGDIVAHLAHSSGDEAEAQDLGGQSRVGDGSASGPCGRTWWGG